MQLTHKIALKATSEHVNYFLRAAGTARLVWNWALTEWKRQYALGQKPRAMSLKKQFNSIKYEKYPWLVDMHRDSHAQPFANLAKAWKRFFSDIKAGKPANEPRIKKKGKTRDSFYVANDKFRLEGKTVILPKIGKVSMTEQLRFNGKILGATVSRTADRWFIAVQVGVPDVQAFRKRTGQDVMGVDLGLTAAATLSTGEKIASPKPLKTSLRRLQLRGRSVSRKIKAAKKMAGFSENARLPEGVRLPASNNRQKSSFRLARLHSRIANLRADFTHKLTTRLCRENQAVVIEDLHVKGMLKNDKLARAMSDIGFGMIRRQLEYKSQRYRTQLIVADRWYPSSKLCSLCDMKNETLTLKDREWLCQGCGITHDRDINAAINLKRLATVTALPVASQLATDDTNIGIIPISGGKVTSVRYECGQQDTSGQKKKGEHLCSHF